MGEEIELTEAEKIAKEHFQLLTKEGSKYLCDDDESIKHFDMPTWYNEELYKKGQQFYKDNRVGIMQSNFVGLICLLAEPRGLAILRSTGRSSTPSTAKIRYLSTVAHVASWYDYDFSPGSKSLESLKKVRKLHYLASKSADGKGLGTINQVELSMTAFGFMGFALVRPELLGIRFNSEDDKKGFVHFWAVICHMLGVYERFNICLLPIDALTVLCRIIIRYILMPLIQLEGPEFKEMVQAVTIGMKPYLPEADYEIDIFVARRLLLVPGYQYKVDNSQEVHCKSLFNQKEIDELNAHIMEYFKSDYPLQLMVDIPMFEITKRNENETRIDINSADEQYKNVVMDDVALENLVQAMGIAPDEKVVVRLINYEREWQSCLNDSKFYQLSAKGRFMMKLKYWSLCIYTNFIGRYFFEMGLDYMLGKIKRASSYYKNRQVQAA